MAEPHALLHEVSAYRYIDDLYANTNKSILVSLGCANLLHHLRGQRQGGKRESH